MGIYIKGMEMPKEGEYRMTLYVCDDGYAYMDVDLFPVDKDRFEVVPVPPHGDLIDKQVADELNKKDYEAIGSDRYTDYARSVVLNCLNAAPIIILAEEDF